MRHYRVVSLQAIIYAPRQSRCIFARFRACRIVRFCWCVKEGRKRKRNRERRETERALRGCGPNYPQWLLRNVKEGRVPIGGRKDGASAFFSSLLLSRRTNNPPREDVSNRFSPTRLQVVLRMALCELLCVIPAYSRAHVGEAEVHLVFYRAGIFLSRSIPSRDERAQKTEKSK